MKVGDITNAERHIFFALEICLEISFTDIFCELSHFKMS